MVSVGCLVVGAAKVGASRQPSLERAARWQGWLPQVVDGDWRGKPRSPEELSSLTDQVRLTREDAGLSIEHFDICFEGEFYGADAGERDLSAWAEAGATSGSRAPGAWRTAMADGSSCDAGLRRARRAPSVDGTG